MQREEADPPGGVDRVLMRVIAVLGDFVGHVVDCDDPIEQRYEHEDQQSEREIVEERIEVDVAADEQRHADEEDDNRGECSDHPLFEPEVY